ncbi:MAG: signal peptidase I [Clostridia bacterium]|nr:signal peptidase I [Clostridia bacterium]
MLPKINMTPKTKKIVNIVVDVVVAIVLIFALFLAVCTISSKAKGYHQFTEVFGKAYVGVSSESMAKDAVTGEVKADNFSRGDMISIKLLSEEDTKDLKVGDIVTFEDPTILDGKRLLNTHRIIDIVYNNSGAVQHFVTHGDNNPQGNNEWVLPKEIIGVYQGKAGGIGHMFLFMSSSAGFFVCIVLPSLLVVAYFAVNLILVIRKEKKAQTIEAEQSQLEERERIRQELLAEMQSQNTQPDAQNTEEKSAAEDKTVTDDNTEDKPAEQKQEASSGNEEDKK